MKNLLKKTVVLIGFVLCSFGLSFGMSDFKFRYQEFIKDKSEPNFTNLRGVWNAGVEGPAKMGFGTITDEEYLMALAVDSLVQQRGGLFGMGLGGEYKGSRSILDNDTRNAQKQEYNKDIEKKIEEIEKLQDLTEKDKKVMELYEKYKEAGAVLQYRNNTLADKLLDIFIYDLIENYVEKKDISRAEELYNIAQEYYTYMTEKHYISLSNVDRLLDKNKSNIDRAKGVAPAPAPAPAPASTPTITVAVPAPATTPAAVPTQIPTLSTKLNDLKKALNDLAAKL